MVELIQTILPVFELAGLYLIFTSLTMFIDAYKLTENPPNNPVPYIFFVIGGIIYLYGWGVDPESAKATGGLALGIYVAWFVCTGKWQNRR